MELRDKLLLCSLCPNMCRFACPMEEVTGTESSSPRGKSLTSLLLLEGVLPWTEGNARPPYQCLDCQACRRFCPFDFDLSSLYHPARQEAVRKGVLPPEVRSRLSSLREFGNPFGERAEREVGKGEVAYLPGCTVEFREREILSSTLSSLERAGIRATVLRGYCCGLPAFRMGDEEEAGKRLAELEGALSSSGARTLLLSCPGCFEFLSDRLGGVRVMHVSTFLLELVEGGRLRPPSLSGRVAYHDPCSLRKRGLFDPPRRLLGLLGLEVVEPPKTREEAVCCGGGNPLEEARRVSRKRAEELRGTGCEVVTACPTCKWVLEREGLRVLELSQLLG